MFLRLFVSLEWIDQAHADEIVNCSFNWQGTAASCATATEFGPVFLPGGNFIYLGMVWYHDAMKFY